MSDCSLIFGRNLSEPVHPEKLPAAVLKGCSGLHASTNRTRFVRNSYCERIERRRFLDTSARIPPQKKAVSASLRFNVALPGLKRQLPIAGAQGSLHRSRRLCPQPSRRPIRLSVSSTSAADTKKRFSHPSSCERLERRRFLDFSPRIPPSKLRCPPLAASTPIYRAQKKIASYCGRSKVAAAFATSLPRNSRVGQSDLQSVRLPPLTSKKTF